MATHTIGSVLLDRLYRLGLRHMFGIPGDYVLSLYELIAQSPHPAHRHYPRRLRRFHSGRLMRG